MTAPALIRKLCNCCNLDIFWLKNEALEDSANLAAPEMVTREIEEDLKG